MRRYLKIYRYLIKFAAIQETTYRLGFFLELLVKFIYAAVVVLSARVLFWNVNEVAGWNFYEMLVLLGLNIIFCEIVLGLAFVHNLRSLPGKIAKGELDLILTKPLNSQFVVSLWRPYFALLPSLIPGFALIYLGFNLGGFTLNLLLVPPFLVIFSSGMIIAYSVGMIISTLSFWLINATPLPQLAEHLIFLAERPYSLFAGAWRVVFLIILPIAFMVSFPAQTLLGDFSWWWVPTSLVLAAIFLKSSSLFWQLGLKHYQSASS
jgi:ABC-2 type transport system permease protein